MPSLALTVVAGALLALVGGARPSDAHLLPSGSDGLLGMMASADGMLTARAAAATHVRDAGSAATPFLAREAIAGSVPEGGFVLDQEAPVLRYAELQDALLLVARRDASGGGTRWVSVQPAGAAIVLASPTVSEPTRDVLRRLWAVAHPAGGNPEDPTAAVAALIDALDLPEAKLRALAYLDLARLATDPEHFAPHDVQKLASYGNDAGDDAQLAQAVRDLATRIGNAARERGEGPPPTSEGKQP